MELSPREKDKLLLFTAALVAERRMARGLKLNYPEAVALISAAVMEGARDGRTVAELMSYGATLLRRAQVMDGVAEMVAEGFWSPAQPPAGSRRAPNLTLTTAPSRLAPLSASPSSSSLWPMP